MIVHADAIAPQPWKNGRGVARELLAGRGWRISLAAIDADGPFSAYPGMRRCFAVVDGAGVVLEAIGMVRIGQAISFDGDAAPHCRLLDGPVQALNLMLDGDARGTLAHAIRLRGDWPLRGRYADGVLKWNVPDRAGPPQLWIGVAP